MRGICRIGTSGWNYRDWKPRLYPGIPTARWLQHYATHYPTVELNASFYRKPTFEAVQRWATSVPRNFKFAVKMWRGITHYRRLNQCADLLEKFLPIIRHFPGEERGPLLIQLPERMPRDVARMDDFLATLRAMTADDPWQVAVEFRHPDWVTEETRRLLERHHVAMCLADMHHCIIDTPNDVDLV